MRLQPTGQGQEGSRPYIDISKRVWTRHRSGLSSLFTRARVACAGVAVSYDALELFADISKTQQVRIVKLRETRELHYTRRVGRKPGAVLGTVGGFAAGVVLAFRIESAGHDERH